MWAEPIHNRAELCSRSACAGTNRRPRRQYSGVLVFPMIDRTGPPPMVKCGLGAALPCKRRASYHSRIVMKKFSAFDKQHRPPQAREVEACCRTARSCTDNNHIPQVIF